jgi:hypothetical protein
MLRFLALGAAVWLSSRGPAREPPKPPGVIDRPWHLAMVIYRQPADAPFTTLEVDLDLLQDVPTDQPFFVMAWSGRINGVRWYTGVTSCGTPVSLPGVAAGWMAGSGYNFTRWLTKDPSYVRQAAGGFVSAASHEGEHVGVRTPGSVRKGRYTYTLRVKDKAAGPTPHFWVEESVHSHATGRTAVVGSLRFDGEQAVLNAVSSSFFEVHGDTRDVKFRPDPWPDLRVAIGNRRIDGKPFQDQRVETVYYNNVPQKARTFAWDAQDAPTDDLDPAMRNGQTVVIAVRDKDWSRSGLDVGQQREANSIGREMGGYTREVHFPKLKAKN